MPGRGGAVDLPPEALEPATAARLAAARAGREVARHIPLSDARPGDVGVFDVQVRQVHPVRAFRRKRGGDGLVARVVLGDGTGEAELVLWDDETRHVQEGTFRPRRRLRLQGATVREARQGGIELALGACVVTPAEEPAPPPTLLAGLLASVGPTRVLGTPPRERFQADVVLAGPGGPSHLVAEGTLLRDVRQLLPGAPVEIEGAVAHPLLDGWFLAGAGAALRRGPGTPNL